MTQIDLDNAKQEFIRLMVAKEYKSQKMLDLMLNTWENADLSPDDAGWVLWIICDQYAIGRVNDPVIQHRYQSEFFELVKRNFPERAHWVVSDATQEVSLLRGGFLDFWCGCYRFANDTVPRVAENRGVRLQSHETNAFSFGHVGETGHMRSALDAMAGLLEEDPQWPGQRFGTVRHKTLLFEFYIAVGETDKADETADDAERMLDVWVPGNVDVVPLEDKPLFGSWEGFTQDWPTTDRFSDAVVRTAVAFAKHGRFPAAERFFRASREMHPLNAYTEALFLLSCLRSGHSEEEIRRMWSESQTNSSVGYAVGIAPELAEVLG